MTAPKFATVTLASGGRGFAEGVCVHQIILRTMMRGVPHACIVEEGAYSDAVLRYMEAVGLTLHVLPPLRTKPTEFAAKRWPMTFTKLHLWQLPYERVVYFDSDAIPCKSFHELFLAPIDPLGGTHTRNFSKRFRSGMMVVEPRISTFEGLAELLQSDPDKNGAKLGDQGLLNVYFDRFTLLPYQYHVCEWQKPRPEVVIGHLRPKPWERKPIPKHMQYSVNRWQKAWSQCVQEFGPMPD